MTTRRTACWCLLVAVTHGACATSSIADDADLVRELARVEQLADVLYEGIAVSVTDAPRDRHILLANPFVGIHVRGGVNRLATLEAQDFTVTISYGTLAQDTTGAVTPDVHLPDGVTLLRVTPPRIRSTRTRRFALRFSTIANCERRFGKWASRADV